MTTPHRLLQTVIERSDLTADEVANIRLEFGFSLILWAIEMAETIQEERGESMVGGTDGENDPPQYTAGARYMRRLA